MTLLPLATLVALLLHFFPCHHVRMEDRELARNDIIRLTDLDDEKIRQNAVRHQIKKRNAGSRATSILNQSCRLQITIMHLICLHQSSK